MRCPKCGVENDDLAATCNSCNADLQPDSRAIKRASRMAIASKLIGLVGVFWLAVLFIQPMFLWLFLKAEWFGLLILISPWIIAILLGISARSRLLSTGTNPSGVSSAAHGIWMGAGSLAVGSIMIFYAFVEAAPNMRGWVSRVRADMRSLSTAIEAYYVDHNIYPTFGIADAGPNGAVNYNFAVAGHPESKISTRRATVWPRRNVGDGFRNPAQLPTFVLNGEGTGLRFAMLTTPESL